jgi:hypothetical protein
VLKHVTIARFMKTHWMIVSTKFRDIFRSVLEKLKTEVEMLV